MKTVTLSESDARKVRALASAILELVPDPDAPVHAAVPRGAALCGRGGKHPRATEVVAEVTCRACKGMADAWDLWRLRRGEEVDDTPPICTCTAPDLVCKVHE